jgi:hypothetical protein
VTLDAVPLAAGALPFVNAVFQRGLAEYAYRNDLPHVLDLSVTPAATAAGAAPSWDNSEGRPLVPVGGGKDSIVSVEALKRGDLEPVLFAVNPNPIIDRVLAASDLPILTARRQIDRQLFDLNARGAYNGHVPVTAMNSLIAVGTTLLHGLGPVVMSTERSASIPNLEWHGHQINHQWSKGLDAEGELRAALAAHAGLAGGYFSLLRPLSELHIARLFSQFDAYDEVVTSCNAAFKLRDASARWCGNCPKCRFVFLAMAPFMAPSRIIGIFGKDMLADPEQLPGYRELLGISAHKPFECVGEVEESQVALRLLTEEPAWRDAPVVRELRTELPASAWPSDAEVEQVFSPEGPDFVPPMYAKALDALG